MKKRNVGFIVGLWLFISPFAFGGLTATIVDTVGDPHSVSGVSSGTTFHVIVQLNTDVSLSALQARLQDTSGSGYFTLNSVAFSTSPTGVWSGDAYDSLDPAPQALNASNAYTSGLIGDIAADLSTGTGTGDVQFADLELTYNGPVTPGSYELNLSDIVYGDLGFDEYSGSAGSAYTVQVIPAPGAFLLGCLGLGLVRALNRRRHSGAEGCAISMG